MAAESSRRQALILTALLVALGAVVGYQYYSSSAAATPGATRAVARSTAAAAGVSPLEPVPPVKLAELKAARPEPTSGGRNLFREKPKAPPPPPPTAARPGAQAAPDPNAPPPPPPPPPPIALKFIGVVQAKGGTVAVFSDGKDVFYGREGELIEGRYKILRIGVESVEMSYADGRGRQRIPLTG
jgi:hypothetical protein